MRNNPPRFALIGAAGYIAPKHMGAIKEIGGELVAAMDIHDSVGILDSYFPQCHFFTEFERFDRHLEKLRSIGEGIDYYVVCTPNYLHDAHVRHGLRLGANVICEKPLVINSWNLNALKNIEKESGKKVYCILQLRLHEKMIDLKKKIEQTNIVHEVKLNYITSRGLWYQHSWKGNVEKSGGILSNIGIHFFDLLLWIFGDFEKGEIINYTDDSASGILHLKKASVKWLLSVNEEHLPNSIGKKKQTHRFISVNNSAIEFSDGFKNLHTKSYQNILNGNGLALNEAQRAIDLISSLRKQY